MDLKAFIKHFSLNNEHFMWFLGAGAPRSAGLPTAYDIIWDLKKRLYASNENRDIDSLDLYNEAIKNIIQNYMDSQSFPKKDSIEEYSFYFEKMYGENLSAQRDYLNNCLINENFIPNIGYKILSALLKMNASKIVFTTNFDNLLEKAYSNVTGENLSIFNIEGSEGALNAINTSSFPFYVKLHGDYRYKSLKNLEKDLLDNNFDLEKCFLSAATRFGLITSGYSGRDKNIMDMLQKSIELPNAYPHGLFWMTSSKKCLDSVVDLINKAKEKGIKAEIIEVDSFDSLLQKIWASIENKPSVLSEKINVNMEPVSTEISGIEGGASFIRTNAFPIIELPNICKSMHSDEFKTMKDIKEKASSKNSKAILTKLKDTLFWGDEEEVKKIVSTLKDVKDYSLTEEDIIKSSLLKDFITRALVRALAREKHLFWRPYKNGYCLIINKDKVEGNGFQKLRDAVGDLFGKLSDIEWSECVRIKLDYRHKNFWIVMEPDIWIEPRIKREEFEGFLKTRKSKRFNQQANSILNAWKDIIFENGEEFYTYSDKVKNNPKFKVSKTTGYSRRSMP
jgi:NAD-dependent SIR2 family protein deacetylase